MTEFLDLADSLLGPTRAIMKFDGAATATRFQAAQARGYKTAAYYYAAPATPTSSTAVANNIPYVDFPGLNYDASQSDWDTYLAYGKPMWGHVCVTQANADSAIAKGAQFVQSTSASIAARGVSSWTPLINQGLAATDIRVGSTAVTRLYVGSTLIWQRT